MVHKHKVGDVVVPTIGPHKGHPHTVIHVHDSGEVNIKPKGLTGKQNRYRMGATTAKPEHLNPHTVSEMNEDHVQVGDRVHAGFGAKGGAGYLGTVKKIDGNGHVHIQLDKDAYEKFGPRTIKAPHHLVTKESVDEAYTDMKGKESFMKKKPLDVKYNPRWHVMSHGKTMERPTKEDVEQIDELKKSTLASYIEKASQRAAHHAQNVGYAEKEKEGNWGKGNPRQKYQKQKLQKRLSGISRAAGKLERESVEPIQELNRKTLQSYVGKATHDMAGKQMNLFSPDEHPNDAQKIKHRHAGIERAMKKLKEEVEQKPTEKPKKKFDYKKFAEYRRTHPEKFIAGVKEEVELDESLKAVVTKKNPDGSYDEVGMRNKTIFRGSEHQIKHKAKSWANGPHRIEFHHPDKFYHDPHKTLHVEEVELDEASLKDACWKGYEAIGMKEKGGKKVPNCVPVNEQTPSGGFGPDSAGVTSGGDIPTQTITGKDTSRTSRKKTIVKRAVKSARTKRTDTFEAEPETHHLVGVRQA